MEFTYIFIVNNMLRHEDRLYHIVVSFPSICAKQFLVFKFRRNEAIYCLIGFGIGIGCCLMYRWFRNTFFSLNYINTKTSCYQCYDIKPFNTNLTNINVNNDNDSTAVNLKKKLKTSTSDTTNLRKKSPKSKRAFDKLNDFEKENAFETNEDIYQNLSKILNKQFCKNFKYRRPLTNRKQFCLNNNNNNNNRKKFNLFQKSNSLSPIQSDIQTTYDSTLTSSTDSTNTLRKTDNNINHFSEDSLLYDNKSFNLNKVNRSRHNSYTIFNNDNQSINGENRAESSIFTNKSELSFYDDDSLELFTNTSQQSSNFDLEYIADIKLGVPMKKSINSVDKSLDEALKHINKLKEDMCHLCSDIDSLYNSKPNVNGVVANVSTISNGSRNSSCSNLHFEHDEDLAEDYTSLNENSRLKTPFRELNKVKLKKSQSDEDYFMEKYTQTERIKPRLKKLQKKPRKSRNFKMNKYKLTRKF